MPYDSSWVPPEVYLQHGDITVYRTYRFGDIAQGPRDYWYSLNETCGEEECSCEDRCRNVFDIRTLSTYDGEMDAHTIIVRAITKGEIHKEEEDVPS